MTKFHINSKGVPAICKAKEGNCPLGGTDSHYNTKEEAQKAVDEINKIQYEENFMKQNFSQEEKEIIIQEILNQIDYSEVDESKLKLISHMINPQNDDYEDEWELRNDLTQQIMYSFEDLDGDESSLEQSVNNLIEMKKIMSETNDKYEIKERLEDFNIKAVSNESLYSDLSKLNSNKNKIDESVNFFEFLAKKDKLHMYDDIYELEEMYEDLNEKSLDNSEASIKYRSIAYNLAKEYNNNELLKNSFSDKKERIVLKLKNELKNYFNSQKEKRPS